ncbi:unnamed protein product [Hymenolepis diminuta]|uniref:G_PROTEIN_RECEP_F1_2 domain-containing protein n=1 Tax=Hymenolepis diminuta TaxID=6216 RepID=A0A0R3SDX2_HYMDI|nr:unnamed protein product [Hymenolepis diminuta]
MLDRFSSDSSRYSALVGAFRAYGSPVIAILGFIGNSLIISIFWCENPSRTRFSIFATSLAVVHNVSLLLNTILDDFLGRGLDYATNGSYCFKLDAISTTNCKVFEYLPNTMYFASSYLVVVFSIDRVLTTYHPIKFHACLYRKHALWACLTVLLIGALGNIPILVVQTLQDGLCRMDRQSPPQLADFAVVFSTVVTFFLPVVLVLALNVVIILQLWRAQRWRKAVAKRWGGVQELGRIAGHLAMSSCFLLLYLPLGVVVLMRLHITITLGEIYTPRSIQIVNLSKFFSSLKDVAYAVNCLVYAAFLPKFRTRLMHRLCIK